MNGIVLCDNCGQAQTEHVLVNYSDGQRVGMAFLLCPSAVFAAPLVLSQPEQPLRDPHD